MSSIYLQSRGDQQDQLAGFQRSYFPRDHLLQRSNAGWQITLDDLKAEYLLEQLMLLAARPGFVNFERWKRQQQEEIEFQERQTSMFMGEGPE